MSIETRILALADAERLREIERRRAAFDRLVAECPRAAEFVQRVAAEFGRPDAIRIRFADGAEFTRGELVAAQDRPDFDKRLKAGLAIAARMAMEGHSEPRGSTRREK